MLETGSRNEQTEFRRALLQEVDGTPEFVFADVVADDDLGAGLDDVADDRLEAGVPAWLVEARSPVEQCLNFRGLHEARIHVVSPLVWVRYAYVRFEIVSGRHRGARMGAGRAAAPQKVP